MNWIDSIAKNHSEWVKIVNSFGEHFYADDIVQEAYIRLMNYSTEDKVIINGEINKTYMYFLLRNTYLIMNRANKPVITSLEFASNVKDHEDVSEQLTAYQKIQDKIDKEVKSWHWYDQKLWHIYRESAMSIRKIAGETKISSKSIFVTLKHCKERIKVAVGEDYEDYINNEYELIE